MLWYYTYDPTSRTYPDRGTDFCKSDEPGYHYKLGKHKLVDMVKELGLDDYDYAINVPLQLINNGHFEEIRKQIGGMNEKGR